MATGFRSRILILFLLLSAASSVLAGNSSIISSLTGKSFPKGFIFGTASASYQYEGAAREGGRGPSIWDTFTHTQPNKIKEGANGDVAVDQYHRYKEDVKIMTDLGTNGYRFSISWSRILPNGKRSGGVNREGVAYYNNLINDLIANGQKPFATLFHWDLPQTLETEYGGFRSHSIVPDYTDYVDVCFHEFGDRVKDWTTFNEPWTYADGGYSTGTLAPGRCTKVLGNCTEGDSATEPYIVVHNMLLAHANAVKLYKDKFQKTQNGKIGITMVAFWFIPYTTSKADREAAQRRIDFMFGWCMDPLFSGEYPPSMRRLVKDRLPRFTPQEAQLVKGSYDFLGINYYTAYYAFDGYNNTAIVAPSYDTDSGATITSVRNGVVIGRQAASYWLFMYPKGMKKLLLYIKKKYNNPVIYITENGFSEAKNDSLPLKKALNDPWRIEFYAKHLYYLSLSIKEGVDVRGYFAWSLLDNFEWGDGYTIRFGLVFVDFQNGLKRHLKASALWFRKFLHT